MAQRQGPVRASDTEVRGFLNPRPIAVAVAVAFGRRSFRLTVFGHHVRRYGIKPDPVKA